MPTLPATDDLLALAERPIQRTKIKPHTITLPIFREEGMTGLRRVLLKHELIASLVDARFTRAGLRLSFRSDDDAMMVKMAFDYS
jgi:hypothetical protein